MADRTVTVKFIGEAKSLTGAIGEVETKMSGFDTKLGGIAKTAAGFAVGGGLLKLPGLLLDGAKGAAEDSLAMDKLKLAIENTGGSYDDMAPAIDDAIKRGQELAFTDGETASALQLLTDMTGSGEEAMRRLGPAMDLARAKGISLEQASKLLGKVSEENTTALSKLGIVVKDGATAQDVLNEVDRQFAGQAGLYAESSAGQLAIAGQQAGELAETFGSALIPVISLVTEGLLLVVGAIQTYLVPAFESMLIAVQPMVDIFTRFVADNLGPILAGLGAFALVIMATLIPAFIAWATAAATAAAATIVALAPVIAIAAGVALAVGALYLAWDSNFLGIRDITAEVVGWLQSNVVPILEAIWSGIITGINLVRTHWDTVWNALQATVQVVSGIVSGYVTSMTGVIATISAFVGGMVSIVSSLLSGDFAGAWSAAKDMVAGMVAGIGTVVSGLPALVMGYIVQLAGELLGALGTLAANAATAAAGMVSGIVSAVSAMPAQVLAFFTTMAGEIASFFGTLVQNMITYGSQIINGLVSGITSVFGTIGAKIGEIQSTILGYFGDAGGWLRSAGMDIIRGLIGGIEAMASAAATAAINVVKGALDAAKDFLHISSPSMLMHREVGIPMAAGIAQGILAGAPMIAGAVQQVVAGGVQAGIGMLPDPLNPPAVGGQMPGPPGPGIGGGSIIDPLNPPGGGGVGGGMVPMPIDPPTKPGGGKPPFKPGTPKPDVPIPPVDPPFNPLDTLPHGKPGFGGGFKGGTGRGVPGMRRVVMWVAESDVADLVNGALTIQGELRPA